MKICSCSHHGQCMFPVIPTARRCIGASIPKLPTRYTHSLWYRLPFLLQCRLLLRCLLYQQVKELFGVWGVGCGVLLVRGRESNPQMIEVCSRFCSSLRCPSVLLYPQLGVSAFLNPSLYAVLRVGPPCGVMCAVGIDNLKTLTGQSIAITL